MILEENGQEPDNNVLPTVEQIDDMSDDEVIALQQKIADESDDVSEDAQTGSENNNSQEQAEPVAKEAESDADDSEEQEAAKKSDTVPHGRFHRENERRKQAEQELEQLRLSNQRLEQRTQQILERMEAQSHQEAPAAPQEPVSAADDPIAALDKIQQWQREQDEARENQEKADREAQSWQQALEYTASSLQSDPDAVDAFKALSESYKAEFRAMGIPEAKVESEYAKLERQHVAYIVQNGVNPVDYVKNLAGVRGWKAQEAQPEIQEPSPAEQLDKREDARLASLSLSNTGGATANTGQPTPQQLAEMSDADFAAYMDKHGSVNAALN